MKKNVIRAELIAQKKDWLGYITYVFKNLEPMDSIDKYVMCIRFPNWDHRDLKEGECGFLQTHEVEGGVSEWFNGEEMIKYKYDDVHFIKFISEISNEEEVKLEDGQIIGLKEEKEDESKE